MTSHCLDDENARRLETLVLDRDAKWRQLVAFNIGTYLDSPLPYFAATGEEGLQILSERPIDVVICDLSVPGMEELQFLQQARKTSARTKVILMAGNFDGYPTPNNLVEQGAIAAIPKTEISTTLIDVLRLLQEMPAQVQNPVRYSN